MDHEKDREAELESAMYTNCLLLGLGPSIIGVGGALGNSRVGYFRHSNPRLGEQLLHFLLSSLRGPVQSAKDFDRVWPIFDSAQSREFRKIVQGIISELETKGALPRSSARISSLATCCGPRFVELLWQLSVHALREVHRRTFSCDVISNPLPAVLTDVSYLNAAALLPVIKARIALERRKFLKNANISDQRQATRSNLANEMTAEFRELCAEEAHLQQELEKMQEIRNNAKLDGELWDDRISSSSVQNSLLVSKATRLWDSLLSRKSQHLVLASGPIEDLIAHREHRYRICGSSLSAAMELSCHIPHSDLFSTCTSKKLSSIDIHERSNSLQFQGNSDVLSRTDDRAGRVGHTVDVAEVLRRWTHALQRIHKQSLNMVKANDGEGPELLNCMSENCSDGHNESLAATLAEHRQHLVSLLGLVNQLKEAVPVMQKSIEKLMEEVNTISPIFLNEIGEQSVPLVEAQSSGGIPDNRSDTTVEMASSLSLHPEKISKKRALKLPHLFNLTPNWSCREDKLQDAASVPEKQEIKPIENSGEDNEAHVWNLRRAVREAALSGPSNNPQMAGNKTSNAAPEHFFVALPTNAPQEEVVVVVAGSRRKDNISSGGIEEPLEQVFSPSFLNDEPFFGDCYEDLLAPLSETDAALMKASSWLQHNLPSGS